MAYSRPTCVPETDLGIGEVPMVLIQRRHREAQVAVQAISQAQSAPQDLLHQVRRTLLRQEVSEEEVQESTTKHSGHFAGRLRQLLPLSREPLTARPTRLASTCRAGSGRPKGSGDIRARSLCLVGACLCDLVRLRRDRDMDSALGQLCALAGCLNSRLGAERNPWWLSLIERYQEPT